jgi:integrase
VRQWTEDDDHEVSRLVEGLRRTLKREPTYAECIKAADAQEMELPPGLADVRLHDLRRTVGSWLTQAQVDLNTIRSALRHASISTTLVYSHLGDDPARAAMEDHGRRVMEIAGQPRLVEAGREKE